MNAEWFKKKELGLPIWVWTIIAAVLIFIVWKKYGGSLSGSSSGGTSGLTDPNSNAAGNSPAGSLVPSPLDNTLPSFGAGAPDAFGTDPLPIFDVNSTDPTTTLPSDSSQVDPSSIAPAPAPAMISSSSEGVAFGGQKGASGLDGVDQGLAWGGMVFRSKSQFQTWAILHGTSAKRELSSHPAAAAIYASLPAGVPIFSGLKGGTKTAPRVVAKTSSAQPVGGQKTATSTPSASSAQRTAVPATSSSTSVKAPTTAPPSKTSVTSKTLPKPVEVLPSKGGGGRAIAV